MKAMQRYSGFAALALLLLGGLLAWLAAYVAPSLNNFVMTASGAFCGMGTALLIVAVWLRLTYRR